jgi:hypothetical protein
MVLVSLMIPKFARGADGKVWRTSESGHWLHEVSVTNACDEGWAG